MNMGPGQGLDARVAVVTGGAAGIGAATARALAVDGAHVAVVDIAGDRAERVARTLRDEGFSAVGVACDVADEQQVTDAVATVHKTFGRIDILHNNAGAGPPLAPVDELATETWDLIINSHLRGCFLWSKHVVPLMRAQGGGAIVNTASVAGVVGVRLIPAYCAAKHGIVGLTRQMAIDLGPHGIRVNAVAPGSVDTEMLRRRSEPFTDAERAAREARVPLRRIGTAEDIARAVVYLASGEARFITGSVLAVDGGTTAQ